MMQPALRVCSFESRRREEMEALIRKFGGAATVAPSLKEVPLEANDHLIEFGRQLLDGQFECLIFLTGVGTTALFNVLNARFPERSLLQAIADCRVVARGPKPSAVLRSKHIRIDHSVPEPNTWREILQELEAAGVELKGLRIAIQEYGGPNEELMDALQQRQARVTSVPVYRWALPDDLGPLEEAIRATIGGGFDVLLWTSAQQAAHAVAVAQRMGVETQWKGAANRCVIGSIGPIASERLRELGLPADLEPSHPKMAHLVRETLAAAPDILARKRGAP